MSVWLDIFCLSPVGLCGHQEWVQADVLPVVCGLFLLNCRLCGGALSSSALTKLLAEAVGASETLRSIRGAARGRKAHYEADGPKGGPLDTLEALLGDMCSMWICVWSHCDVLCV